MRKARNHLLSMENTVSEALENNKRELSDWESSFWRTNLIEAQETIKRMKTEILSLKEALKIKEQDLDDKKEVNKKYKGRFKNNKLYILGSFLSSQLSSSFSSHFGSFQTLI